MYILAEENLCSQHAVGGHCRFIFSPITADGVPHVMAVNPSVPARTVPEFIAYAKANPGKVNMASGGNGTSHKECC